MYTTPTSGYLRRSLLVNKRGIDLPKTVDPIDHKKRIKKELRDLGLTGLGLLRLESRYLPHIIHPDEHIGGVVCGYNDNGFAMLVATDRRIIFLDKKPLFVEEDEVNYKVVSGVKFSHAGIGSVVTLHTRIKDYAVRTLNQKTARNFVEYIESRSLEREGNDYDQNT
jgi:hypothetical protein